MEAAMVAEVEAAAVFVAMVVEVHLLRSIYFNIKIKLVEKILSNEFVSNS